MRRLYLLRIVTRFPLNEAFSRGENDVHPAFRSHHAEVGTNLASSPPRDEYGVSKR